MNVRRFRVLALAAAVTTLVLAHAASAIDPDPVEGQLFTRVIATFSAPVPASVSIEWGDGTTTTGSPVPPPAGKGEVTASHTYAKQGAYSVKVTDKADASNFQRASLTVKDAPITVSGTRFPVAAAPGGVVVARVVDGNPLGVAAGLKATIDWGDGATGDGTITDVAGETATFEVRGTHAYPDGSTYVASVSVTSNDGGDTKGDAQATADGAPEPAPRSTGRILDLGRGSDPSLVVDEAGTAHVAWATPAPGRTGDAVVYCTIARGAKGCGVKRTFFVDALTEPVILRSRLGALYIVVSYNGTRQIGGGTLIMTSKDGGSSWDYSFYRVNTGVFQGRVIDATLSQNERTLYALFGDFVPGDKAQVLATIGLDRATFDREDDPGKTVALTGDSSVDIPRIPYSVRSIGVLPDGRVALAGYDTAQVSGKRPPRAAIRLFADADGNPLTAPWTPIRAGFVLRLRGSPRGASALASSGCAKGIEISAVRGTRLGAPRPLGADGTRICGPTDDQDLFIDKAGGRHALWLSDADGCQGSGPDEGDRTCIIYRRARPGGDFGPKTTIATPAIAHGLRLATAPDGEGWIAWREFPRSDVPQRVKITPTFTSSEVELGKHRIALAFTPGSECAKRDPVNAAVRVAGPVDGRPKIERVTWSTSPALLPRRRVDTSTPFSVRLTVDRRAFYGLSSTGTIVFTMTVRARVRYRVAGRSKTATLTQPLSFYCGIPFSRVR